METRDLANAVTRLGFLEGGKLEALLEAGGEEHALTFNSHEGGGLEVGDDNDFFANEGL